MSIIRHCGWLCGSNRRRKGRGQLLSYPHFNNFIGRSESARILGDRGILIMWQLVFALCHRLKSKNHPKKKHALWSWPILWILTMDRTTKHFLDRFRKLLLGPQWVQKKNFWFSWLSLNCLPSAPNQPPISPPKKYPTLVCLYIILDRQPIGLGLGPLNKYVFYIIHEDFRPSILRL